MADTYPVDFIGVSLADGAKQITAQNCVLTGSEKSYSQVQGIPHSMIIRFGSGPNRICKPGERWFKEVEPNNYMEIDLDA